MTDASDRRRFLRSMLDDAAKGAREVAPVLKPLAGPLGPFLPSPSRPAAAVDADEDLDFIALARRATVPAVPVPRPASLADLDVLAVEHGLGARVTELRALARRSTRLTPADVPPVGIGWSRLGGLPDLPADVAWPRWQGRHLTFVAQLDLGDPALAGDVLPDDGVLLFFCATDDVLSGRLAEHRRSARVIHVPAAALAAPEPGRPPRGPTATARPQAVRLSRELMLPRVWSAPVEALALDDGEDTAWERLRDALAAHQGLDDDAISVRDVALHRALGYPDEESGSMPLVCELVARGVDVGDGFAEWMPEAEEIVPATLPWRLLLQLSLDDALGWSWGDAWDTMCFWIEDDLLRERSFGRALAIPQ